MLAIGIVAIVVCGIALAIGLYIHDYMESYMLTPLPLFVPTALPSDVSIPQGGTRVCGDCGACFYLNVIGPKEREKIPPASRIK